MRQEAVGGISNEGYWGVPVEAGRQYALSLYLSAAQASILTLICLCISRDSALLL